MKGITAAGLLLLVLGSTGTVSANEDERRGRTSALRLLETRTVNVTSNPRVAVTTRTSLRRGASYRLVISGTITTTATGPGYTIGDRLDAFYCYEGFGSSPNVNPSASCTNNIRRSNALSMLTAGSAKPVDTALGLPPDRIRYQPSHRYSLSFKARRGGKLSFGAYQQASVATAGSFTVKLYGEAARKKKRRRARTCPAPRAGRSRVGASSTCHWVVNFYVNQEGVPVVSVPAFPEGLTPGFVEAETLALGKMFFSAEPETGRKTIGRVAATIVHTDTYQSALNPFAFTEGGVDLEPITGFYLRTPGEARINMQASVTRVTGPPFAVSGDGRSLEVGDKAGVLLVAEPPRDDRLIMLMGCGACGFARGTFFGSHGHKFIEERGNRLSVRISRPQPL